MILSHTNVTIVVLAMANQGNSEHIRANNSAQIAGYISNVRLAITNRDKRKHKRVRDMGKSSSSEDYLKCIWVLQKKHDSVRSDLLDG